MKEDPLLKYFNDQQMKQEERLKSNHTKNDPNAVKVHRGRLGLPPASDFIFWLKTITTIIVFGIIIYAIFI